MTPLVTVLMSVHNGAAFVGDAVRSILEQTFGDFELVVIDDGSDDGSSEIVAAYRDPRVRILRNESNLGLTRSLNIGLAAARGGLVARQDADDISLPDRLRRQVTAFAAQPAMVLLGTQAHVVSERGRRVPAAGWRKCTTPLGIEWQLMFENPFVHSSVMFRRDVILDDFSGYDETFRTNQDIELWSRVAHRYPAGNLDDPLLVLRVRARSVSKSYSIEALRRVGDRLIENRTLSLRRACEWDEALRIYVAAMNPGVCLPVHDLEPFIVSVREMLHRFEQVQPRAAETPEIRRHVGSLFTRLANLVAAHAPREAFRVLSAAREFDRGASWRAAPLVAARVLLGSIGRGRPSGTEELVPPPRAAGNRS